VNGKVVRQPRVYSYFDPPPGVGVDCSGDEVLTKQSFAEEADLNFMMARYGVEHVALLSAMGARETFYGDFSDGLDYLEAHGKLLNAQEAFMSLSAPVRRRFGNDPAELLDFLMDPGNRDEAISLGLVNPVPAAQEPVVGAPKPAADKPASGPAIVAPGASGASA